MKILSLQYPQPGSGKPEIRLMADSSILLSEKPFFIPDFADGFTVSATLALRISRVGKCIAPRFAHRYFDSVTAAAVVTPQGLHDNAVACNVATSTAFDGALWLGTFVPVDGIDATNPQLELAIEGTRQCTHTACRVPLSPADIIAEVSRQMMLKMGDIILTGNATPCEPLAIGDTVTASLQGDERLRIRVK